MVQLKDDDELIISDDGTTDDTGRILDDYSNRYSNIKVYHQKNKGVSSARNRGIGMATGDWIYFLDGDDTIEPFFFEEINGLIGKNVDLILFGFNCVEDGRIKSYVPYKSDSYLRDFLLYVLPIHISSLIVNNNSSLILE